MGASAGQQVFISTGIVVSVPATEQLLAMKLCAWRDDVDIADARRLIVDLPRNREDIWKRIEPYLFPGRELTAKYAYDDLREAIHAGN